MPHLPGGPGPPFLWALCSRCEDTAGSVCLPCPAGGMGGGSGWRGAGGGQGRHGRARDGVRHPPPSTGGGGINTRACRRAAPQERGRPRRGSRHGWAVAARDPNRPRPPPPPFPPSPPKSSLTPCAQKGGRALWGQLSTQSVDREPPRGDGRPTVARPRRGPVVHVTPWRHPIGLPSGHPLGPQVGGARQPAGRVIILVRSSPPPPSWLSPPSRLALPTPLAPPP